jgi:hypothetical protein
MELKSRMEISLLNRVMHDIERLQKRALIILPGMSYDHALMSNPGHKLHHLLPMKLGFSIKREGKEDKRLGIL